MSEAGAQRIQFDDAIHPVRSDGISAYTALRKDPSTSEKEAIHDVEGNHTARIADEDLNRKKKQVCPLSASGRIWWASFCCRASPARIPVPCASIALADSFTEL